MAGKSHYSIKPFRPPLGPDDGVPLVVAAEVRLLSGLVHPNVIRPVTIGESSDGHHLVTEYVEGTSLEELRGEAWRRGHQVPLRVTVRILLDALAGLAAVHELTDEGGRPLGLVHRGMSPASVLIGVDGVARVANLGVARRMGYMDAMRKQHIDRRAELFALGVMLWEGAANRRLFEPENDGDQVARFAQHTAPRLDAVTIGVPRGISSVCARALDPDVTWRFSGAAAMAEALEGAALDAQVLADRREVARFVAEQFDAAVPAPVVDAPTVRRRAFAAGTAAGTDAAGTDAAGPEVAHSDPRGQRPPAPPPAPGGGPGAPGGGRPERFGKYTVVRYLAAGGMAEVYLARATGIEGFEKKVVIKRLKPELAANPWATEQFLQEARIAATLQHPQIAQVHDVGAVDGSYYYAMEHVDGQDLRMLLKQARRRGYRLPIEIAIRIVAELCGALHHAHDKCDADGLPLGVVHRDVSPSNVLISYDGAVKLCDFGIAEVTARRDDRKRTRAGKLSYMSPEQCRGDLLDRRSDVFVLAIVLYELTTMNKLFRGASERELMRNVVEGRVRPPSEVSPGYPRELERIVMKSLAVDPAARHSSALEMMIELEAFGREHKLALSSVGLTRVMDELFPPAVRGAAAGASPEAAAASPEAAGASPATDSYPAVEDDAIVEIRPPRPWYRGWLAALALAVAVIAATVAAESARRGTAAGLVARSRAAAGRIADRVVAAARTAERAAPAPAPAAVAIDAAEGALLITAGEAVAARLEPAALAGELPRGLVAAWLRTGEGELALLAPPGARAARAAREEIAVPLPAASRLSPLVLSVALPPLDTSRLLLVRWIAAGFALACLVLYLDGNRRHRWWRRRG